LWAALPFTGWNRYVLEGAGISCSIIWESGDVRHSSYVITIFVFCFLLPLALIIFSYFHVFMTVKTCLRIYLFRRCRCCCCCCETDPAWIVSNFLTLEFCFFLSFHLSVFVCYQIFSQTRPHFSSSFCRHLEQCQLRNEFAFQQYWIAYVEMRGFLELWNTYGTLIGVMTS
jgi:hypothetical protein